MPIAELEEFIFQTDCTRKKNYHRNLNYFYLIKLNFYLLLTKN